VHPSKGPKFPYSILLLEGIFNNKEVDKLVGESYKRVSLKEIVKAWLTVIVKAFI